MERPSRHHRQHLTLAVGQRVEWIARSSAPDQLGHNRRIDHQTAPGHPAHRIGELGQVSDPLLEQVPGTLGPVLDQRQGELRFDVRRQDKNPHPRMAPAECPGRIQPLGGVRRGHPDVDDAHVWRILADPVEQRLPVGDLGGHLEPGLGQHPGQSLPEQHRIVGNHHPHAQSVPPRRDER